MLQKLFGFDPTKNKLKTEIIAGITTFLTMAYILAVNPSMFTACGMPAGSVFTATALAAITGTLIMSLWAKLPFALAPGMGLNAFFVFTVCLGLGHTWQFALTAILIEGLIFIILTLTNVREAIVNAIPRTLKNAIGAGIGLFIAFVGLQGAGIIVDNGSTLVSMSKLTEGTPLLAIIGLVITAVLLVLKVKGALLIGILATTIIGIPMGATKIDGFVSTPPSISPIFCQFEWANILTWDMFKVVFTFLFIDMFDTIGTVIGVTQKAGMMNKEGKVDGIGKMLMADAVATCAGACLGTSTKTTYVESSAGVSPGGRTGLTAFTIAV